MNPFRTVFGSRYNVGQYIALDLLYLVFQTQLLLFQALNHQKINRRGVRQPVYFVIQFPVLALQGRKLILQIVYIFHQQING